jgi:hypothetical protein
MTTGAVPVASLSSMFPQTPAQPAAQARTTNVGEASAEVLAQEWVATGGGGGGGGSPKK